MVSVKYLGQTNVTRWKSLLFSRVSYSIVLTLLLLAGFLAAPSAHARSSSTGVSGPRTWHVLVGGQSKDEAIQGEAFYPGVITIDVGDTVVWTLNSDEPHTVTFLGSGEIPPECVAASDFSPCPVPFPSPYDGIGFVGSGFMKPPGFNWDNSFPLPHGNTTFALTFANPGAYVYQSVLTAGIQGVVVVQPKGAPYPFSQGDYSKQAKDQLRDDLDAGLRALASFKPTRDVLGPGGTETHFIATGISAPETATVTLSPQAGSTASGTASLEVAVSVSSATLTVKVDLQGLSPGTVHSARLDYGVCGSTAKVSPFLLPPMPLDMITVGPDGTGESVTTITTSVSGNGIQNIRIPSAGWFVTIGATGDAGSSSIICGNVVFHNVTVERFLPAKTIVSIGDTVVWQQLQFNGHPFVVFPAGQMIPPFPDVAFLPPNGNATSYDGATFFTAGALAPDVSLVLTLTQPGTIGYVNPLEVGMQGSIIVRSLQ